MNQGKGLSGSWIMGVWGFVAFLRVFTLWIIFVVLSILNCVSKTVDVHAFCVVDHTCFLLVLHCIL
jgi:hypothetical protein